MWKTKNSSLQWEGAQPTTLRQLYLPSFLLLLFFYYVFCKNEKETYELQPTNLGIGLGKASCLLGVAVTVNMERHELELVVPFQ